MAQLVECISFHDLRLDLPSRLSAGLAAVRSNVPAVTSEAKSSSEYNRVAEEATGDLSHTHVMDA
jgi:hypothetical protein